MRLLIPSLLLAMACDGTSPRPPASPPPSPQQIHPRSPVLMASETEPSAASVSSTTKAASGTRGEVVLVPLGRPFPAPVLDAIERGLRDELQVEVIRHERVPLPKAAYYPRRKRYRAEKLLDHLLTLIPDAPPTTRVLGLTTTDISTTKGTHEDWGIFGLGLVPGQAAVVSIHRLGRGANNGARLRRRASVTAVHEVGHTFGLDHCPEKRCPMQDAQGSIDNTDSSTGHLGPQCRAALEARFPRRETLR
ncbi:MAG: hypothetical protein AB1Z98_16490 [Nannocystaceae bacterium]